MVGRGTPSPISTSGQTGTNSKYWPSVSVMKRSCLWFASKRTRSPSRQAETPTRIGRDSASSLTIAARLDFASYVTASTRKYNREAA